MSKVNIVPNVKEYIDKTEAICFTKLSLNEELDSFHYGILKDFLDKDSNYYLVFKCDLSIAVGAYFINVYKDSIECIYSNLEGKHNSICTLRQLLININKLTTCQIYDEPLFKTRAVMIDISRNKVPKLQTLKDIAYHLSLLKINDLQLYMEGRSFYYNFLEKHYENKKDFLLPEELLELYYYCESIGITLTPNTNCFGHMAYWLNQEELSHLAMKPEGFEFTEHGTRGYAQTIDPDNAEAVEFILKQIDELLMCFPKCKRMTIGGDEPFELLFPKKDPNAKEIYLNHMIKIIEHVKSKGITPCMWGDVVKEYPDTLEYFKDAVLLEWGYHKGSIKDENCKMYNDNKISYMVCPGTSGWLTFSGKMENMIFNYKDAVVNGGNNGAKGIVITDWNDGGSYSQLPTNLLTYAYGACFAWGNYEIDRHSLHKYLDKNVFNCKISDAIYELGNYYLQQENESINMTKLFTSFFSCQTDGVNIDIKSYSDCNALSNNKNVLNYSEIEKTSKYLDEWNNKYNLYNINQYTSEVLFIYKLIRHSLKLNTVYLKLMNVVNCKKEIEELSIEVDLLIAEYYNIWHHRNKRSDFKYSVKRLEMLRFKYLNLLELYNLK